MSIQSIVFQSMMLQKKVREKLAKILKVDKSEVEDFMFLSQIESELFLDDIYIFIPLVYSYKDIYGVPYKRYNNFHFLKAKNFSVDYKKGCLRDNTGFEVYPVEGYTTLSDLEIFIQLN